MLPAFYQAHLQSQLSRAEYLLLSCLIQLLQTIKQVRLEALATALPLPITFESRRRKLQRFLDLPQLRFEKLWFPIFKSWLTAEFEPTQMLYIAIDRTSWGGINLMMVSLIVDKRAIPIYGELLAKIGSSNLAEQKAVLSPVLTLFKEYKIVVLGDREFCSVKLGNWLQQQQVCFCLRLKRNEYVQLEDGIWLELNALGLVPGSCLYLNGISVTKQKGFCPFNLAAKWKRKYRGWAANEGWFILTNLEALTTAVNAYQKRFDIEEMFRDWKLGGYNLEGTQITGKRFIALILLLTIAYSCATLQGRTIKRIGVQKYIGRLPESRRTQRRHSSFYIGLYGQTWVNYQGYCAAPIAELMKLNRNKSKYYQKGLRAMELILSAS